MWQLIRDANAYIEEQQPWATHKAGDAAATAAVLGDCLEALRIVALLASPVIPRAATELWRRLGLDGRPRGRARARRRALGAVSTAGNALEKGPSLFPRSTADRATEGGDVSKASTRITPPPASGAGRPGPHGHRAHDGSTATATCPEDPAEADAIVDDGPGRRRRVAGVRRHRPRDVACGGRRSPSRRPDVVATVGLHPHDAVPAEPTSGTTSWRWPPRPRVVAVGECGLDHHYEHSPGPDQAAAFRAQIRLAHELGRTLVIHTREAWDETFAILDDEGLPERTVFHCFTGRPRRGAGLSRPRRGPVVQRDRHVQERRRRPRRRRAARRATGCWSRPTAPTWPRSRTAGEPNRPAWVGAVGEGLAAARTEIVETVADATRANAAAPLPDRLTAAHGDFAPGSSDVFGATAPTARRGAPDRPTGRVRPGRYWD